MMPTTAAAIPLSPARPTVDPPEAKEPREPRDWDPSEGPFAGMVAQYAQVTHPTKPEVPSTDSHGASKPMASLSSPDGQGQTSERTDQGMGTAPQGSPAVAGNDTPGEQTPNAAQPAQAQPEVPTPLNPAAPAAASLSADLAAAQALAQAQPGSLQAAVSEDLPAPEGQAALQAAAAESALAQTTPAKGPLAARPSLPTPAAGPGGPEPATTAREALGGQPVRSTGALPPADQNLLKAPLAAPGARHAEALGSTQGQALLAETQAGEATLAPSQPQPNRAGAPQAVGAAAPMAPSLALVPDRAQSVQANRKESPATEAKAAHSAEPTRSQEPPDEPVAPSPLRPTGHTEGTEGPAIPHPLKSVTAPQDPGLGTKLTAAVAPIAPPTTEAIPGSTPALPPTPPSPPVLQVEGGLRWMLRSGAQEANLQLHPEALGQMSIHLRVEGGEVHAQLWIMEPATVQAVQEGRAHLEQSLKEQGLQLGSFDLHQGHRPFQEQAPTSGFHPAVGAWSVPGTRQEAPVTLNPTPLEPHRIELYA